MVNFTHCDIFLSVIVFHRVRQDLYSPEPAIPTILNQWASKKPVDNYIINWYTIDYMSLGQNANMLITMIFYGSEHIGWWVKISVTINESIDYKDFCGFMGMLIGSKIYRRLRSYVLTCSWSASTFAFSNVNSQWKHRRALSLQVSSGRTSS